MKTIKVGRELYPLPDNPDELETRMVEIVHTYRSELIQFLIATGLDLYLAIRFSKRIGSQPLSDLKRSLVGLANSHQLPEEFADILKAVNKYDYYVLPSATFYKQIDDRLQRNLVQTEISFKAPLKRTPRINVLAY
jgi:hypothetical protein